MSAMRLTFNCKCARTLRDRRASLEPEASDCGVRTMSTLCSAGRRQISVEITLRKVTSAVGANAALQRACEGVCVRACAGVCWPDCKKPLPDQ